MSDSPRIGAQTTHTAQTEPLYSGRPASWHDLGMNRKPTSLPHVSVLPKHGPAYRIDEPFPSDYRGIEARVARDFVTALNGLGIRAELGERPDADRPDAMIRVGDRRIGVELVEVVDGKHRAAGEDTVWFVDSALLEKTIVRKLEKDYKVDGFDEIWLLAWDSFGYLTHQKPLEWGDHLPVSNSEFSAIWVMWVVPTLPLIERLWPPHVTAGRIIQGDSDATEIINLDMRPM